MIRKTNDVQREAPQNGSGVVTMRHIISQEEMCGKGRLFAHMVVPPGASFGLHRHIDEVEPYYILKGHGDFTDEDGTVTNVGPGDCCLIHEGGSHAIKNNGDEDLEFIALIYNVGDRQGHSEAVSG